jgi:hypothetical protein
VSLVMIAAAGIVLGLMRWGNGKRWNHLPAGGK